MMNVRLRQTLLRLTVIGAVSSALYLIGLASGSASSQDATRFASDRFWIEAGQDMTLPAEMDISNAHGKLGILNTSGPVRTKDHPFFEQLGINPRGCVTCHQPVDGMSLSVESLRERWRVTKGDDPVFAPVDGSNNPKLPQALESSHSLLLKRGLFRVGLPWPPAESKGKPEFTIEVVRDPTGVNLDSTYGLTGVNPTVSVFRRPRPAANLKYMTLPHSEPGKAAELNLMADGRHLTLRHQAFGAYKDHQEGRQGQLPQEEMQKIIAFENQIYVAQSFDQWGGSLVESGGPAGLGPLALVNGKIQPLADSDSNPVFRLFDIWKKPEAMPKGLTAAQREFRASVARGNDIFLHRQFRLRDVAHFNSIGQGNPIKQSCVACHNAQMTGERLAPGWQVGQLGWMWERRTPRPGLNHLYPATQANCQFSNVPATKPLRRIRILGG